MISEGNNAVLVLIDASVICDEFTPPLPEYVSGAHPAHEGFVFARLTASCTAHVFALRRTLLITLLARSPVLTC